MKKNYEYKNLTKNWYQNWIKKNIFEPKYEKNNTFCIVIPPPNITGRLHMGHAFQCTIMDLLIRYYRMNDYAVLWKMGTDHAGIATQLLIEQKIKNAKTIVFEKANTLKEVQKIEKIYQQLVDES